VRSYSRGKGDKPSSRFVIRKKVNISQTIKAPVQVYDKKMSPREFMDLNKKDKVPTTNIPILWHYHKPYGQERRWMKPLDFLSFTHAPKYGPKEQPYAFSKGSLKGLDKAFSKGKEMYSLRLDVDIDKMKVVGHEGRHRAYWAYKKGLPYVPVIVWHQHGWKITDVKKPLDMSKIKTEAKVDKYTAKDVALRSN